MIVVYMNTIKFVMVHDYMGTYVQLAVITWYVELNLLV